MGNDDESKSGIRAPIDAPGVSEPLCWPAPPPVLVPSVDEAPPELAAVEPEPEESAPLEESRADAEQEPTPNLIRLVPTSTPVPEHEPGATVPAVVALLQEALEAAQRGELQAVALAGYRPGVTLSSFEPLGLDAAPMLLALERLRLRLLGVDYDHEGFSDPDESQ